MSLPSRVISREAAGARPREVERVSDFRRRVESGFERRRQERERERARAERRALVEAEAARLAARSLVSVFEAMSPDELVNLATSMKGGFR